MASKDAQAAAVQSGQTIAPTTLNNPRRPPAHRSVSLLHSQKRQAAQQQQEQQQQHNSDSSSPDSNDPSSKSSPTGLKTGKGSSGESSNADKWFDQSNNELRDASATFADGDPPFFMRNSSSSETPPEAQRNNANYTGVASALPMHADLLRIGTDGSSTEEYRGVIDDLTIENKKLKRRLKKYEKMHDSHLKDERLFEVRIHGLPTEKKRELEETLRKFAEGLVNNAFPSNGYNGLMPMLPKDKTASSMTSLQQTDSAYASMSASGQGSSSLGNESRPMKSYAVGQNAASKRENIHSFLHHIPEGLLPQSSPVNMTERMKKKIVVRRLEQIFAGKGAALGGHQHPQQQQEVSNLAARADKTDTEAHGRAAARAEGHREANIMVGEVEDPADPPHSKASHEASPNSHSDVVKEAGTSALREDQRPTRPLDLDPHRAQVPVENLQYMRHLGFSPYDPMSSKSPEEGHGWVYLNLLINMAQLHTINVTSEFVRKAVAEYSSRFEVSADGRKVRWKGGRTVTRTSSSGGASNNSPFNTDTTDGQSPRKRPKLTHLESLRSEDSRAPAGGASARPPEKKMMYTPLFFHRSNSDESYGSSSEEEEEDLSSYARAPVGGESSALTSSGMRTIVTKKKQKREDGPIIFYNNARFCTDLSGDRKVAYNANAPPYVPASSIPLGKARPLGGTVEERRGPLADATELPEAMDLDDNPIPSSMELFFPPTSPMDDSQDWTRKEPLELEVTGIGGVWPADNFTIDVQSRHARFESSAPPTAVQAVRPTSDLPAKLARILRSSPSRKTSRRSQPKVARQILRTAYRPLAPASLPPALSFMPYNSSSFGDDQSEYSSDEENRSPNPMLDHRSTPSAAPQPVGLQYDSTSEEGDVESLSEDESEGSLDLLAAAREMDPQAVREQEREYDANMAERLAEEIPAGSSAATAGGGSGFNSPVHPELLKGLSEEFRKGIREARLGRGGAGVGSAMKRATTSDSITALKGEEDVDSDGGNDMLDDS
ncbi:unnamed protein product [Zymoseptoria tritici ST99CH_1E4]|uniref:Frequency clock protein n=1 Tax=Zymoseptoria tritici ST99CH_1E4 TaxID=1276532 RepID=A0A2H1GKX2_ZYMTR|nr:unnamed protein product [Zymoseptoria tritici ST99CH_1E4]